jgi:hypothetical protein
MGGSDEDGDDVADSAMTAQPGGALNSEDLLASMLVGQDMSEAIRVQAEPEPEPAPKLKKKGNKRPVRGRGSGLGLAIRAISDCHPSEGVSENK